MKKRIYICSGSDNYRSYVKDVILAVESDCLIFFAETESELFKSLSDIENTFILCDKFFLGFKISPKISILKNFLCRNTRILVADWNVREIYFPLRLKNLKIDGFINNIGNTESFIQSLKVFFEKGFLYSDEVESIFLDKTLNEYNRYISDVTDTEIDTILQVLSYGSPKEIESDSKYQTLIARTHCFKRKMGIVSDEELSCLVEELKKGRLI